MLPYVCYVCTYGSHGRGVIAGAASKLVFMALMKLPLSTAQQFRRRQAAAV